MKTEYPSRVDWWLGAVLIGAPLVVIGKGALLMTVSIGAGIVTILSGLLIGGFMAALAIPCVYTLSEEMLTIRCGLLREEVPLRKIRGAERSSSLWSAPALSVRRVRVVLENGSRVISPRDRDGFIADLHTRLAKARPGAAG